MLSLKCRSNSRGVVRLLNISDHHAELPVVQRGDNFENFVFVEDADSTDIDLGVGEMPDLESGSHTHDD